MASESSKLTDLWKRYAAERTVALRNQLVEAYMPIVRSIAAGLSQRLPEQVEFDDLVSDGTFGLIGAVEKFEPSRGLCFKTYCSTRIRGAMFDGIRGMDWVPRRVRSQQSRVHRAREKFHTLYGRLPTEDETAVCCAMSHDLLLDAHHVTVGSLNHKWYETDNSKDVRQQDILADERSPDPTERLDRAEQLRYLTRGLDKTQRLIVVMYYAMELTMKEIGVALGLSESRVSQMHSALIEFLKERVDPETALVG